MRSFDELESLWQAGPAPLRSPGTLRLIVVRKPGGAGHETPPQARLDLAVGLEGDRWPLGPTVDPDAQITLMNVRVAELIGAGVQPLHMAGDNLLVDLDLGTEVLPAGTRLRVGGAVVEVTAKPHTGCKKFAERFGQDALRWVNWQPFRARRLRGVNCRIVEPGRVALGDPVAVA